MLKKFLIGLLVSASLGAGAAEAPPAPEIKPEPIKFCFVSADITLSAVCKKVQKSIGV